MTPEQATNTIREFISRAPVNIVSARYRDKEFALAALKVLEDAANDRENALGLMRGAAEAADAAVARAEAAETSARVNSELADRWQKEAGDLGREVDAAVARADTLTRRCEALEDEIRAIWKTQGADEEMAQALLDENIERRLAAEAGAP